jgi:hypothetical protein
VATVIRGAETGSGACGAAGLGGGRTTGRAAIALVLTGAGAGELAATGKVWAGFAAFATTGRSSFRSKTTAMAMAPTITAARTATSSNMRSKLITTPGLPAMRAEIGATGAAAFAGCCVCDFWAFFRASLIRLIRRGALWGDLVSSGDSM